MEQEVHTTKAADSGLSIVSSSITVKLNTIRKFRFYDTFIKHFHFQKFALFPRTVAIFHYHTF
jgi:hypothetical protein